MVDTLASIRSVAELTPKRPFVRVRELVASAVLTPLEHLGTYGAFDRMQRLRLGGSTGAGRSRPSTAAERPVLHGDGADGHVWHWGCSDGDGRCGMDSVWV